MSSRTPTRRAPTERAAAETWRSASVVEPSPPRAAAARAGGAVPGTRRSCVASRSPTRGTAGALGRSDATAPTTSRPRARRRLVCLRRTPATTPPASTIVQGTFCTSASGASPTGSIAPAWRALVSKPGPGRRCASTPPPSAPRRARSRAETTSSATAVRRGYSARSIAPRQGCAVRRPATTRSASRRAAASTTSRGAVKAATGPASSSAAAAHRARWTAPSSASPAARRPRRTVSPGPSASGTRPWRTAASSPSTGSATCRLCATRARTRRTAPSTGPTSPEGGSSGAVRSEVRVELHVAGDADLVRADAALEEIRQLLHVLELHERERVGAVEASRQVQLGQALVRDELEVPPHVRERQASDPAAQEVRSELELAVDGLLEHLDDQAFEFGVEQLGLLAPHGVDDLEGEGHVSALVAEHPVGARGEAVQQATGTQEIDVGECREEEQPFDARGEADQVEHEGAALRPRLEPLQVLDRVHPTKAELRLLPDAGDVVDGREGRLAILELGHVGVEQREVELDVQRLLVQLPGEIEPSLGRVDVPIEVEHEVVGDDRVARREKRHEPLDQVAVGRAHALAQVSEVRGEVHLFDGPRVLDRRPVHLEEARIAHGAQQIGRASCRERV